MIDEDEGINEARKYDLESGQTSPIGQKSSAFSRDSAEDTLIHRRSSSKSDGSGFQRDARMSQKIYIVSEDLTVVIAGFTTKPLGMALYFFICVFSVGLGYLFFRWLPSWKVGLVGSSKRFRDSDWVVIEVGSEEIPEECKQ